MTALLQLVAPAPEEWIGTEEAMSRTGWSLSWLRQQRLAGAVVTRESGEIAANGRAILLYLSSSLPSASTSEPSDPAPSSTSITGPLFAGVPAEPQRIVLPDPDAQKQAEERYALIAPLIEYPSDPGRFQSLRLRDGRAVVSRRMLEKYLCESHQVSRSTLLRWLRCYLDDGFGALGFRQRSDRNISRWARRSEQHAELIELAIYAYLEEKLSKQMAWEIAASRAKQLQMEPPTYECLRALLENLPAPAKTLALLGRRKYDEIFASHIRRGYQDMGAGEILVSDHAIHDVLVQNDLFDSKDRAHMRLRFTGLIDMRARMLTGYAWSQEGSSRSIVTCLRRSLTRFGCFRVLYVDNGKDYQKVGKGARGSTWNIDEITPEAMGVIARLNSEIKHCQPFHPQAKLIERFNNTLHQRFDRRFATYTGPTPEQRPDRCVAALERHKKLLAEGRPEESDLPLASEFIRAAVAWIEGEYHQRPHGGEGMDGLTPIAAFEKFRWEDRPAPPRPSDLAVLLAERETRRIQRCAVEIGGRRYLAADSEGGREMHDRTGQSVLVAFDPADMEFLAALDEDGNLVAYLKPETMLRQSDDEETRAAIAASMKERRGHHRATREKLDGLSRRVLATGYVPQNEQMLQVGRLPIEIDDVVVRRPQTKKRLEPEREAPLTPAQAARLFMEAYRK